MLNAHLSLGTLETFRKELHVKARYFILLRDPIRRVLSEFRELLNVHVNTPSGALSWEYKSVRLAKFSFESWLNCSICSIGWSNRQTRMLGKELDGIDLPALRAPVTKADYTRALRRIDEMAFVGIVDRFAESWELIAWELRLILPIDGHRFFDVNAADRVIGTIEGGATRSAVFEPTVAQSRRLEEANRFDRSLFRYGLARFERDLASYRKELGMEAADRGNPTDVDETFQLDGPSLHTYE